ncbi:hypothetical protein LN042_23290 [Kitasatospora sp. RB6PN24]|uniref:hypothetical protein n=1 Tax=Kitasatospora humi TaxID=2893891 RepID=UPI001E4E5DD6|nr:hypothetical protein [Kitasatospora humi]MCC9309962.1 hypothetical protein [Kitasatospora humi]
MQAVTRRGATLTAAVVAGALVAGLPWPAYAGQGNGNGSSTPTTIESHVVITDSANGSVPGAQHLTSVGGAWDPPPCWYEPTYTPDQFDTAFQQLLAGLAGMSGSAGADALAEYQKLKADGDFHRGQPGLWWAMVKSNKAWDLPSTASCDQPPGVVWVPTGTTPPGVLPVTPEMLSKLAYGATKLPPPQVKLSPAAGDQTVNLPTFVSFSEPIQPVSVTASLDYDGIDIAASTLAVPTSLQVDAGTSDASPSTCTYPFTKTGGGYQVDSSTANCNITYQRSSRGGSYPLTARVTWRVTWNPSKDPNGQPQNALPDGLTGGTPQAVIVKEIQTVVTG